MASSQYIQLLRDFAVYAGLSPVESFLQSQEIVIAETTISFFNSGDESSGDILFFTILDQPVQERVSQVHRLLLQANFQGALSHRVSLGVRPGSGNIICWVRTPLAALTARTMSEKLDEFVNITADYRILITQG